LIINKQNLLQYPSYVQKPLVVTVVTKMCASKIFFAISIDSFSKQYMHEPSALLPFFDRGVWGGMKNDGMAFFW
jgi:hypothetical protein